MKKSYLIPKQKYIRRRTMTERKTESIMNVSRLHQQEEFFLRWKFGEAYE